MKFITKVIRNALILGLGYFASTFATYNSLSYLELKPIFVFMLLYISAELVNHYKLSGKLPTPKSKTNNLQTLIL